MWWRRKYRDRRPVRPMGEGIGDGDTILMHGQRARWTDLVMDATRELPVVRWPYTTLPVATASTDLVRPYVLWSRR